jgi:nicotinate-nucleotide adenylyltransferase
MAGARHGAGAALTLTGILGGSFNPAHRGHRRISLFVADAMGLDEIWWLVSPGNPLKPDEGMAPYPARLASARKMARRSIIRASDIETELGTRFTADTLVKLIRRYPKRRFVWIMGADNLGQFHLWRDWRRIARMVPIAVIARPGYEGPIVASPATAWLRRFVRPEASAKAWTQWRPPALVLMHFRPDPTSATALRRADPDWHRRFSTPQMANDKPPTD